MKKDILSLILMVMVTFVGGIEYGIITSIPQTAIAGIEVDSSDKLRKSFEYLSCPRSRILHFSKATEIAGNHTGIDSVLIACLIYTESGFNEYARSRKGYVGLMQTPTATGVAGVDILYGASILKEKLHLAKGNLFKALTLYKGGNNHVARKQAREVITLYRKVMRSVA